MTGPSGGIMAITINDSCTGCTACVRACPVAAISGARSQRHRIDPSRCIGCGACGRVCPVSAVLDSEGRAIVRLKRAAWMQPAFDLASCIGCACCVAACPVECLVMEGGQPGGLGETPHLAKPETCVSCELCVEICPVDCVVMGSGIPVGKADGNAAGEGAA